jgi:cysteine sulfinate desulfinase/cysteine desulfurase-like protein
MGIDEEAAHGSLRLTLGRSTTAEEVMTTIAAVQRCVARLRSHGPTAGEGVSSGPRPA